MIVVAVRRTEKGTARATYFVFLKTPLLTSVLSLVSLSSLLSSAWSRLSSSKFSSERFY